MMLFAEPERVHMGYGRMQPFVCPVRVRCGQCQDERYRDLFQLRFSDILLTKGLRVRGASQLEPEILFLYAQIM